MDGSLTKFIDKIGGEYSGKLSRDYEVSRLLKSKQGTEKIQVFNVDDISQISSGNVVDSKRKILESLSVNTLEDAYNKLLDSFSREGKIVKVGEPKLKEGNLKDLPFVKFYEKDGGYYLTSSLIIACYKNICNASIHRIMMLNDKEAAVRIVPRHLYYLYNEALKNNEILPVSVIIGIHPAIILAASSSPQLGYFELNAAANILGNLEIYNSPIHKNPIPLGAAAIIEGFITEKQVDEGPFVEAMGGYDKIRKQPVLKAEKVYLNSDETTHVILPGGYEHAMLMGFPREASIYNAVSKVVPKVHGVHLTLNSGGWLHAIISIDKNHDGDSKNAILAAFSAHPSLKHVIVVDPDVNIYDINDVEWAIATRFQADRDLIIINNARGSTLDPSAKDGLTSKMGIDATKPLNAGFEYERAKIP
ncbi:MAG: UbiD family decarboxylase [Caldisphaera sp.]|uniref:UbiD family decarboxylase n=1 Tax=Caldisphaera sp. TaxID=2060322 RepID=UPI000CC0B472|nr:MAG: UbiD family decarboxylase [Caldisphaera sp.]PMP92333.1 MAG: UbiD family decarboxylase [Caldisphaera sp.]